MEVHLDHHAVGKPGRRLIGVNFVPSYLDNPITRFGSIKTSANIFIKAKKFHILRQCEDN